jgi:hypothetical protein
MKLANFKESFFRHILMVGCVTWFLASPFSAQAITLITDINLDQASLERGYTVSSQEGNFQLGIFPDVLSEESRVVLKQYDRNEFAFPTEWSPVSDVYEFDIYNKEAFKNKKPLVMRIKADAERTHLKKIFFWNGVANDWKELPSRTIDNRIISAVLHLPYAKLVLLEHGTILQFGEASWYKYKGCSCAASPDYKKGTKLKVINKDNGREIIVTVNDFGPDRGLFPKRIIDLDKTAFKKLGWLSWGTLKNVSVEEVKQK